MKLSKHANIRSQQRGVKLNYIEFINQFGNVTKRPGEAIEIRVRNKEKDELIRYCKWIIQNLDKISRKAILKDEKTDLILTVYNIS
jgi:hypothetical protein